MKNSVFVVKAMILASGLALAGGCATIEQLEEVRAIAEGRSGGGAADAAAACCSENSKRIDRLFERTMRK